MSPSYLNCASFGRNKEKGRFFSVHFLCGGHRGEGSECHDCYREECEKLLTSLNHAASQERTGSALDDLTCLCAPARPGGFGKGVRCEVAVKQIINVAFKQHIDGLFSILMERQRPLEPVDGARAFGLSTSSTSAAFHEISDDRFGIGRRLGGVLHVFWRISTQVAGNKNQNNEKNDTTYSPFHTLILDHDLRCYRGHHTQEAD